MLHRVQQQKMVKVAVYVVDRNRNILLSLREDVSGRVSSFIQVEPDWLIRLALFGCGKAHT